MVWRRKHHVASFHLVGAEAHTCAPWGGACPRTFFPFFFRCEKSPSRGAKCKKNTFFFLCNAPAFTFKHCESQRRSWECARELRRIAKIIQKVSFCWKCTIFTRCLIRVGCEFWDLSRTHKGHVSAVKCRRIFALSSGTPPFSNISFCPSWPVCHLREHLYMCSSNPSHTLTCICHLLNFSSASLTSLMFSPSSLFCYYGVCASFSLSV